MERISKERREGKKRGRDEEWNRNGGVREDRKG